jgi:hypothetical protein
MTSYEDEVIKFILFPRFTSHSIHLLFPAPLLQRACQLLAPLANVPPTHFLPTSEAQR